ncbi:DNA cytosine methyltransferase [Lactococcus garvieae]|uniref:DNA cytosine methyltransferase n=1 Tax=Lactococcus garvieae TaxID=1363 RepID=UPI0038539D2C
MNSKVLKFTNNVFDLEVLSNKEFIEMIDNFSKISKKLGYIGFDSKVNGKTVIVLKKLGIITEHQLIDRIQSILKTDQFNDLIKVCNSLIEVNIEQIDELKKFNYSYRRKLVTKEKTSNKPTIVDLFCGAGGLSLGFVQNGYRIIFANDIEKSTLRTYSFNHPEVEGEGITLGGIEDIAQDVRNYIQEEVDVLVGGPPCQGFSMANRQRIIDDPRNILYKYYVESVKNLKPKIFLMENVKGMKNVADQVVEDFNTAMDVHYDISFEVFNAKLYGVPQNRERLIYIGIRKDVMKDSDINAEKIIDLIKKEALSNEVSLIDSIGDLKELKASRVKNSTEVDSLDSGEKISLSHILLTNYTESINLGSVQRIIYNHKARYNNDRDIEIYDRMHPGDKSDSERIKDIMPYKNRNHIFKDKYFKLFPNKPCKTITAHMKFDCNMYIHPFQARGLTPREAARVQSFPDSYFFLGPYTKTYMQIGNSVPPLLSRKFAEIIKQFV